MLISVPDVSFLFKLPANMPENAAEDGPTPYSLAPTKETWKKLMIPGLKPTQF